MTGLLVTLVVLQSLSLLSLLSISGAITQNRQGGASNSHHVNANHTNARMN